MIIIKRFSHALLYCASQNGDSALMLAASHGDTDIVVDLIKAGASFDIQNKVKHYS